MNETQAYFVMLLIIGTIGFLIGYFIPFFWISVPIAGLFGFFASKYILDFLQNLGKK